MSSPGPLTQRRPKARSSQNSLSVSSWPSRRPACGTTIALETSVLVRGSGGLRDLRRGARALGIMTMGWSTTRLETSEARPCALTIYFRHMLASTEKITLPGSTNVSRLLTCPLWFATSPDHRRCLVVLARAEQSRLPRSIQNGMWTAGVIAGVTDTALLLAAGTTVVIAAITTGLLCVALALIWVRTGTRLKSGQRGRSTHAAPPPVAIRIGGSRRGRLSPPGPRGACRRGMRSP